MPTSVYKDQFLLNKDIVYLNHGSFGACPKKVFNKLIYWQQKLENQPVEFLEDKLIEYLDWARLALASYLNCGKDDLVFFPNPSAALNAVIKSLDLKVGDEVLTTNHEYGAIDRTWRFMAQKKGFSYKILNLDLPITSTDDFVKTFSSAISSKTKILFISHITSPTGLIFPPAAIPIPP